LWPGGGEDSLVIHQAAVRAAGVEEPDGALGGDNERLHEDRCERVPVVVRRFQF
jgi:hypothetical protein